MSEEIRNQMSEEIRNQIETATAYIEREKRLEHKKLSFFDSLCAMFIGHKRETFTNVRLDLESCIFQDNFQKGTVYVSGQTKLHD